MCPFKVVWLPRTAHLDLNTSSHILGVDTGELPVTGGAGVAGSGGTVMVPFTALAWVLGVLISTSGLRRDEGSSFHSLMVWSFNPLANNPPFLSCSKHLLYCLRSLQCKTRSALLRSCRFYYTCVKQNKVDFHNFKVGFIIFFTSS